MSEDIPSGCFLWLIGIVMGLVLGIWGGIFLNDERLKKEAVNHGAAEYILNPATGETKWQWKNQPKEGE